MPQKIIQKIVPDDQKHSDAMDEDSKTGEQTVSGSMPDPESDDDTLENAHKFGLYKDQDEEHPGELGVDEEVHKDELEHQIED